MTFAVVAAAAVVGAVLGYAFRGSIRNDIAKIVAAVKADLGKIGSKL